MTKRTLAADELVRVAGTRGDALRAVERLPGVARPPMGMGFVIIRGSAPTDSAVQMEGVTVPRLYHFGGLTSFVQGRLLDRIDLVPGNFSARYGRKVGGIIEVALRDPKSDAFHGMIDVNVIDASAMMEGPVTPTLSLVAAFRRSYIDAFFGALANSSDLSITAAPVYYDYQLMAAWRPREADRVRVIVYGSTDNFKMVLKKPLDGDASIRGGLAMSTAFHRVQAQWLHHFGERAEQELSVTTGPLMIGESIGENLNLDLNGLEIMARAEWRVRLSQRFRLLAGIDTEILYGDLAFRGPKLPAFEGDPNQYSPFAGRGSQAALLALAAELGRSPETIEHILLTHGHVDHIGAARALCQATGARVHAHPAERHWIETVEMQAKERPMPGFHGLVGGDVAIHHLLSDGQRLDLAPDLHLRVLHCPGHSPGSTCFFLEEEGLVFSGDVVPLPGDMPVYDDPLTSLQSLRRLQSLPHLRGLLSAWDIPRLGEDARTTLKNAIDLIERIHTAVRIVSQTIAPTNPLVFCRAALRELQWPEGMVNPLVARTFHAHYLVRDRPTLLEWVRQFDVECA